MKQRNLQVCLRRYPREHLPDPFTTVESRKKAFIDRMPNITTTIDDYDDGGGGHGGGGSDSDGDDDDDEEEEGSISKCIRHVNLTFTIWS